MAGRTGDDRLDDASSRDQSKNSRNEDDLLEGACLRSLQLLPLATAQGMSG